MRSAKLLFLLVSACSTGGARCLAHVDCPAAEVCSPALRCEADPCRADLASGPIYCRGGTCPRHHVCDSTVGWFCVVSPDNRADLATPAADMRGADMAGCR